MLRRDPLAERGRQSGLMKDMLRRDPLAECGRQSGLMKDMLNQGRRPKNRWAPTPGPVFRQVSPGGWYFFICRYLHVLRSLPHDVSEIVASYGISPSWGRCLLEYEVSFCGFVTVSMAVSDDEHVNGCMLGFLSCLLFL